MFQVVDARDTSKSDGQKIRVILSHRDRAITDDADAKYLFYPGFHKSAELYGQEILWLHEDAREQIRDTGRIVLTEGPFDVAKACEAGLRNIVGSFGSALSDRQIATLKALSKANSTTNTQVLYDRADAGRVSAEKAAKRLKQAGLTSTIFDWEAPISRKSGRNVHIPAAIRDLAEFSTNNWLGSAPRA